MDIYTPSFGHMDVRFRFRSSHLLLLLLPCVRLLQSRPQVAPSECAVFVYRLEQLTHWRVTGEVYPEQRESSAKTSLAHAARTQHGDVLANGCNIIRVGGGAGWILLVRTF